MKTPLAAPALVSALAALAVSGAAAPHRAPVEPAPAANAAPSRLQSRATPSPAPGAAPGRRAPTTPPAAWQAVERSRGTGQAAPGRPMTPALPAQLPPLPPPPPPLPQPAPAVLPARPATQAPAQTPAPQIPAVEYLGLVEGPGGTYVILRAGDRVHVARPGQSVAGARILRATPERVRIRAGGAEKTLHRLEPGGRTGP